MTTDEQFTFELELLAADVPTINDRVYPLAVIRRMAEQINSKPMFGTCVGPAEDLPLNEVNASDASHVAASARVDDGKLIAQISTLDTARGRFLRKYLVEGGTITRRIAGIGTLSDDDKIVGDDFQLRHISVELEAVKDKPVRQDKTHEDAGIPNVPMTFTCFKGEPESEREARWEKLWIDTRAWYVDPDGVQKGGWVPARCETGELGHILPGQDEQEVSVEPAPGERIFGVLLSPEQGAVAATFAWSHEGMVEFMRWSLEHLSGSKLYRVKYSDTDTRWELHNGFEVAFRPAENAIVVYWPTRELVRPSEDAQ